jgi:hypothetical protein
MAWITGLAFGTVDHGASRAGGMGDTPGNDGQFFFVQFTHVYSDKLL